MNFYSELMRLIGALNEADIPYALCGGVAVGLHGFLRATEDIDLLVPRDFVPLVKQIAKQTGFRVQNPNPIVFSAGREDETVVHRVSKFSGKETLVLDLIEVGGANRFAWKSRRAHSVAGTRVWAIGKNALIRMKRKAGRPQDLFDIEGLEGRLES